MWQILTVQTREEIYYSKEQKGCRKGTRGSSCSFLSIPSRCISTLGPYAGELLYILGYNQHIFIESKKRQKYLLLASIDYKNAYDMVTPNCLKMYKIPDEVM